MLDDYGFNHIPNLTAGNVAIQNYLLKHKLKGRETITIRQIRDNLRSRKQFDGVTNIQVKLNRVLEEMEAKGLLTILNSTVILNNTHKEAHQ